MIVWLFACAASKGALGDPCLPSDDPTLALGTGETTFVPLVDGDAVELVHGPQGGYHTYVGFAATGLDGSAAWTADVVGWLDGAIRATSAPLVVFRCDHAEGRLESAGALLVWDGQPEELDGQPITVEATLTDARDVQIDATIDLVIHDPLLEGT